MRRGPAATGQSQEREGQQRSADDASYGEVATRPHLVRGFQPVVTIGTPAAGTSESA